jgi:RimJ/RimL family protein N-acetyltransferase
MSNIRITDMHESHIPELWNILNGYAEYFDDSISIASEMDFRNYVKKNIISALVAIKDENEIIGCAYISNIDNGLGEVNIFTKRRSLEPRQLLQLIKENMRYFIDKYNLSMLYAITRTENKSCVQLLKNIGFKYAADLPEHRIVGNKKINCVMYCILKEEIL